MYSVDVWSKIGFDLLTWDFLNTLIKGGMFEIVLLIFYLKIVFFD